MDLGFTGALLGGVISLLSPCSVMLLPAFFSYAFGSPAKLIGRTGIFYLGLITALVPLGVFSGALGSLVSEHRGVLVTTAALVVILAGLVQLLGVPIPGLSRTESAADRTSAVSVFVLGTVYAVAGVCAGPVLGSVLMVAALGGSPVYGGIMLALYGVGMVIPLFVLAALWQRTGGRWRALARPRAVQIGRYRNTWVMIVSGLLSVGVGILLLASDGTASLGGFFTIGAQYRAESWVTTQTSAISDLWFVLAAALALALLFGLHSLRNRKRVAASAR
ncbi:cytochrome c biogenesis CcdA family protein [Cryobacterium sp. PH29-G1]|uniref:cytochrome c biogenesis CcdA family protein n=1 Tax=Cryobacterium sp. PH29-G1 TaxID=3046211 RepID=UPI0024BBE9DF|nr:cytochrome c biogenesis CcdA family protein [Cryobacterium sp. PH29-G1]MDJ0348361.1 cytochrome c biogenesis CcdA family protein [Cryobacterium sp. PH29-G1]